MPVNKEHIFKIKDSGLFDEDWYLSRYPDVRSACMHPIIHYLAYGELLGRDPNPGFNTRFYLQEHPDVAATGINPLVHYITHGMHERRASAGCSALRPPLATKEPRDQEVFARAGINIDRLNFFQKEGAAKADSSKPTIMVCAHVVGCNIYGAERSFIDILEGLNSAGYNVISTIPRHDNQVYVDTLLKFSSRLVSFNYAWWRKNVPLDELVVTMFERVIRTFKVDAVHINTIMLREPRIAATRSGIPVAVHVREIIEHDVALTNLIGRLPNQIITEVNEQSSYVIANSQTTADAIGETGRTFVVENCIDTTKFSDINWHERELVNVGLISSNIPKKGIHDFVQVAALLLDDCSHVKFLMIGPENPHVQQLQKQQKNGELPANIYFPGYFTDAVEAYELTDIVLNLSHFQESFGRTVLEGMTAGKPVIAYDWGALSELIRHGETGFLVPFKDTQEVARRIRQLCEDPELMQQMGVRGREFAVENYSKPAYASKLAAAYESILGEWSATQDSALVLSQETSIEALQHHRVSVVIPNYNYAQFLEDRISSVLKQTVLPAEIIFLDDNSNDDSVALARKLLENSGMPFRIFRNHENLGTYQQWIKGIQEARGDFIWIAEADDSSEPDFLEHLLRDMNDQRTVISYCQSLVIDEHNDVIRSKNLHHTDALSQSRWLKDYRETGLREVVDYLLYRNTIPNVSACLFRSELLKQASAVLDDFRYCGDWLLYCLLLKRGDVAFNALPLNYFRRHSGTVTRSQGKSLGYFRELLKIKQAQLEQFPVHPGQIPKIREFLDTDYRFEGLETNSEWAECKEFLEQAGARIAQRRRFAMLTTNNGSFNGGSEMLWVESASALRARGHDVIVVIKDWDPPPPFFEKFFELGIKTCFKGEGEIEKISKFHPDLIVVSTGDQDEGTEYFGAFIEANLPYVIINQLTKQIEYWPLREKKLPAVRTAYQNAVRTFFTCWNSHRIMESRLGNKITNASLHYNPYHIDRDVQLPFPSFENGTQIAMPSKLLHIHKGQRLVIELMAREKWKHRDVTINLYGEGPDEAEFKRLVAEKSLSNIQFHPRVSDLLTIWRTNHAILMASFMEGLPIVLVSAMLSRRVPILTDIGGHAEVIDDNRSGFLASKPTLEDLDDALGRAISRVSEWEEIGKLAREQILDYLPEDPVANFVDKIEACCEEADTHTASGERISK